MIAHKINPELVNVSYGKGGLSGEFLKGLIPVAEGSESSVYKRGKEAIKISEPYYDKSKFTYRNRIASAFNISDVLGDRSTQVIGNYRSPNGTLNPVFSQNFIEGRPASADEIRKYMESRGFSLKEEGVFEKKQKNLTITARDLDPDNVRISPQGKPVVIDADLTYRGADGNELSPSRARKFIRPNVSAYPKTEGFSVAKYQYRPAMEAGRDLMPAARTLGRALGTEAASLGGMALRGAGRLAGPVGVAMTAYDLAQAFPAPAPISEEEMGKALRSYRTGPQPAY